MIDAEARVGRVLLRARHVGWDDDAVANLAAALRRGATSPELEAAAEATAPRALGPMLALAFGGGASDPDSAEVVALSLVRERDEALDALLDHVDPAAPCWPGAVQWLAERGVASTALLAALTRRSAVWVSLDGGLAAVGVALRRLLAADPVLGAGLFAALSGDAAPLMVARCVRALAADASRDDALLSSFFLALPPGLRGAGAEPLLALGRGAFVEEVLAVAEGRDGATSTDAASALEALLRHHPDASEAFVDEVLAPGSRAPSSLRAEVLRVHGPRDPARYARPAAEHASLDPGEWTASLAAAWPMEQARPLWEALLRVPSGSLATRAAEALLGAGLRWGGELAATLLREPGAVSRDALLAACLRLGDDEIEPVLALLDDRASEVRLVAVRALAGRGDAAASALASRYREERAPRVRAAIVSALGYEPAEGDGRGGDPVRAAVVARAEAGRVGAGRKPSRWLERCEVPLRWSDGAAAPRSVAQHLVRLQSLRGSAEPDAELVEVARMLHPADRECWAESLVAAWIDADAPAQDHGVLLIAALLGGEFASRALGEAIPLWHKGSRRSMAASAVQLLAMRAADHSLCALDVLARQHPHESFGASAQHALDEEARARSVSTETLLDLAAPTYGFTQGARRFELGHHTVRVELRGAEVALRDESGELLHGPPRASKRDDPDRVAELRRLLRLLHQTLADAVEQQRARLLDAMASRREFSASHLRACLDQPVLGPLCGSLWWLIDGAFVSGDALGCGGDDGSYVIAHALDRGRVEDLSGAPFAQRHRPTALPSAALGEETLWTGFVGRELIARGERHARAQPPWAAHGWTPGTVDHGQCRAFSLRFNGARVEAVLEVDGIALWSESERRAAVGALRFERWAGGEPLALGALPPTLFSEAVLRVEAMLAHAR